MTRRPRPAGEPAFVRGLWGDHAIPRHRKALDDVRRALRFPHQARPQRVFCCGRENAAFCLGLGLQAELLRPEPVVDWLERGERGSDPHMPYGVSVWRHKLEVIHAALATAAAIVWLDWDCRLVRPLPPDFWARLAAGPPLQSPLNRYVRPKCPWRSEVEATCIVPSGPWVYCRDRWVSGRLLELQTEHGWYDETCYARWIDDACGGWPGVDGYVARGYDPGVARVHRGLHPPARPIFYAPLRYRASDAYSH